MRTAREMWRNFPQIMSILRRGCAISLGDIRHFGFWKSLSSADLTETSPQTPKRYPSLTPLTMV